jgi:hypothetical protein
LGYKANNLYSTKKVIEILTVSGGKLNFNSPLFKADNKTRNRIIFEFNAQILMTLKYEEKMNMIVFDHLSFEEPSQMGQYEHYVNDFSYDGFRFKRGKWIWVKDIDPRNPKEPRKNIPKRLSKEIPIYKSE